MANSTSQGLYLGLYHTLGDVSGGLYCLHRHRTPTSVTENPISVRYVRGRVDCPRVNIEFRTLNVLPTRKED